MWNIPTAEYDEVPYLIRLKMNYAAIDLAFRLQSIPARCYGIN